MKLFKDKEKKLQEQKEAFFIESENKNKRNINDRMLNYEKEERLKVDEEVLEYKNKVVEESKLCADSFREQECNWHSKESEKNTELAKLDAAIDHKRTLLEELKDIRETEIKVLKDMHTTAIKDKDGIIELLKAQVEILTSKFCECNTTDINVSTKCTSDK